MHEQFAYSNQPTPYVEGIGHANNVFVCYIDVVSRDRVNGRRFDRIIGCYSLDEDRIKEFVDRENKRNNDLHEVFSKHQQVAKFLLKKWCDADRETRLSYEEMQVDICNRLEIPQPLREAFMRNILGQTEWLTQERYSYTSVRTLANYDIAPAVVTV